MATYNINISDLATTLQNADANTVDTPHTINISEITQNDVDNGTIRTCLLNNPTKYVIINILAGSTVTDVSFLFGHYNTQPYCTSLIGADISALTNATTAQYTFQCCTNIKSANISKLDKVTRTQFCFAYCTSLKSVYCDNLYSLRFAGSMFNSCSSLTDVDVTSFRNVIAAEYLFYRCTALTEIDTSGFVSLNSAREMFNGCTALTEIDISSMNRLGVLSYMFQNCTNLETITLPDLSSVTEAGSMFNGCSSLEEIHGWSVPLTATMTDCFTGCTSLQAIYVPEVVPQESTWHAWDIKKDTANTRSDVTIYGTSGIPVTAQIPSSGTYSLEVSGMTDELLFSSTKAITSAHIQKMMQTQTPITGNTDALDPTKDNFVMLAKDRTAAKTNVTTDVVEAGNLLPPTSAAVHAAIAGGIPTGTILDYPGTIAPAGFALCIGQTAMRSEYINLIQWAIENDLIGENKLFGDGDGVSTFEFPDLREVVLVGSGKNERYVFDNTELDPATGTAGTQAHDIYNVGEFKDDQMQKITGTFESARAASAGNTTGAFYTSSEFSSDYLIGASGSAVRHSVYGLDTSRVVRAGTVTHSKQIGMNYIIRC